MWSNMISIDKSYDREIDYILFRLCATKDVSYAVEESKTRLYVYLASACENIDSIEEKLLDVMQEIILSFLKMRFFRERVAIRSLDHARCALICSLVNFDREFECNIISKHISSTLDYNIDGLFNFRLRTLKESWQETIEVANRLLDTSIGDDDIYDIAGFITGTDGKKSQLVLRANELYSLTKRKNINRTNLFDENEYNLLFSLIREKPSEILLENTTLSKPMMSTLKHITRVVQK